MLVQQIFSADQMRLGLSHDSVSDVYQRISLLHYTGDFVIGIDWTRPYCKEASFYLRECVEDEQFNNHHNDFVVESIQFLNFGKISRTERLIKQLKPSPASWSGRWDRFSRMH